MHVRGIGLKLIALGLAATAVFGAAITAPSASAESGSASNGALSLTVSNVSNLNPAGDTVTVTGSGYDIEKGIYVAFCVMPAPGTRPTPCGGGVAMDGSGGASHWISSNPPPYGIGLAIPYGPGGTFSVNLNVNPAIGDTVNCTTTSCAVVTFRDHLGITDRSQDLIVPVTFGSGAPAPTNTVAAAAPTQTPVPQATTTAAPSSTVAAGNTPAPATPTPAGDAAAGGSTPGAQASATAQGTSVVSGVPSTGGGADGSSDDGSGSMLWVMLGVLAVAVAGAAGYGAFRYQRSRT